MGLGFMDKAPLIGFVQTPSLHAGSAFGRREMYGHNSAVIPAATRCYAKTL